MMRQYELVERVQRYKPDVNEALLNKAYVYAMQKHGHQKRASGDPYFSHPLEVAAILTDLHLDEAAIAVALLHDTIEDTDATRQEIDQIFGPDIGKLVEGLTKLKKLELHSKKAEQAENLRKLLLAISDDVRVLLVKLADRLHNMRTMEAMRADKQIRISEETMEIYAPLAGRMGMQDLRDELEALSFRYINPVAYRMVTDRLTDYVARNADLIETIESQLGERFEAAHIHARVKSRQKTAWSIFRKMERKTLSFEQLSDIFGFRVVVYDENDCYRALGAIHREWSMVPGRFKDYISTPKQNGYQSIHTTIVGPSRQRIELQIRTEDMDQIAEYGVAAHAAYKEGRKDPLGQSHAFANLRRTIETLVQGEAPEEFLENTKLELFHDQVFCFTPKGRVIALPRGATPIDFAYAVHTQIGDTTVSCKINGAISPLMTELVNGDEVEIITSETQTPPAAWENMVVTGKARAAIRRATRMAIRKQYSGLGRRIIERAFGYAGKEFSIELLTPHVHRFGQRDPLDVLAAVGRGEISSNDVMKLVYPDWQGDRAAHLDSSARDHARPRDRQGWFGLSAGPGMLFHMPRNGQGEESHEAGTEGEAEGRDALPIRGVTGDLPVSFGAAGAVPGDRIVGILTPGRLITIYPIQSDALIAFEDQPERWVDVRWDIDSALGERFPARIAVTLINQPGSLATIANIIADLDANIHELSMTRTATDFTEMRIDLEVWDLKHLTRLQQALRECDMVSDIRRLFG
ncbi:bifunctional (p)ppGpp synthetase/guanosine-3',5'-bis(diphosphate) 3'-pyrophosphohydrolase [Notoacmeibacter marinus]|uniref:GTP pyrophosphokinase rsh n=1 Tax=Notoacmeibacter marinus TaxID=1876515 RepID=A0A231UTV3_9HYPH|nr:bifunctional (p)ppGpp synthetase/guanosine-3',5'-bis(diphosphate) 3'-pyrophosphohydrolase [Notoacmeibacter marinus]OXS99364.1 bifunctional (p)ppGpp synthetase/guanosine-3',5'-bis(diphosphate) 3'-pyrophosphohydrolase [Notoacmeibacter marinus]